ncbi:hypothetical protein Tco_0890309 [Tanacetum coccineum]|uniref:Uncharacterized protein n=1 Tax=Tanacetum coccineum TaxID=301880 RepID=A0ABQ5C2R1_9ASTR
MINPRKGEIQESSTIMSLAYALEKEGVTAFRFDFAGNGEGGNVVLLYVSKYLDVHRVINVSGRYKTEGGVEERWGKGYLQKVKEDSFIDVKFRTGEVLHRVIEESLMDRLDTTMHEACLQIDKDCNDPTSPSTWPTNLSDLVSVGSMVVPTPISPPGTANSLLSPSLLVLEIYASDNLRECGWAALAFLKCSILA